MSYDIELGVKVEGYKVVGFVQPELAHPTYNLRPIFVKCTGWNYKQGEWYKVNDVIENIEKGIHELRTNHDAYIELEPDNGWGTVGSALEALESLHECIVETNETVPVEFLWVSW